jgi:hypothetical protein
VGGRWKSITHAKGKYLIASTIHFLQDVFQSVVYYSLRVSLMRDWIRDESKFLEHHSNNKTEYTTTNWKQNKDIAILASQPSRVAARGNEASSFCWFFTVQPTSKNYLPREKQTFSIAFIYNFVSV